MSVNIERLKEIAKPRNKEAHKRHLEILKKYKDEFGQYVNEVEGESIKKYTITCTEEQLRLIATAVEDWHRFLSGDCEMFNATLYVQPTKNMHDVREILHDQVHPLVTPELPLGGSYGWSGSNCPNEHQKKVIAMSYGIYRQILHFFASQKPQDGWNVYQSPTLTCEEQGPLIKIEEIEVEDER